MQRYPSRRYATKDEGYGCVISDATLKALHHVKVSRGAADLRYFPDFMIVGPQRTGTTWLHAQLRYHPEIMLSEPKELYFFSSLKDGVNPRFPSRELADYLRFFREPLWRVMLRHAVSLTRYGALYRPKVRGEATASYAVLDRDVIQDIVTLKPDLKVILMIRNPVERAWSHAKKDLARNRRRKLQEVSATEFERFFTDPYQRQCARYVEHIENWSACLRPGHLLVALFDDIDARPEALLLAVMSFLDVASDRRYISGAVREAVNPTGASAVPEQHRRVLEELFADDMASLKERLGVSWSASRGSLELSDRGTATRPDEKFRFALRGN